jgi:hypothetical protein
MKYVLVPNEVLAKDLRAEDFCFSPGRYVRFSPPRLVDVTRYAPLDKLVVVREEKIGAVKSDLYGYAEIGDINIATGGISFREMRGYQLPTSRPSRAERGDVLISTVRTYRKGIGLVSDKGANLVTTNAVLNLCGVTDFAPEITLPYVYAFLRSEFFTEQVWALLNRGVYPRMDTGALDKIVLPIANNRDVCTYVAALAIAISDKEQTIRIRNQEINYIIERELAENQIGGSFSYTFPSSHEVGARLRMDAAVYSRSVKLAEHKIKNYRYGWKNYNDFGFSIGRGQNLQESCIGPSIYSDTPKVGFYRLVAPTDISEFRTVEAFRYLGNVRKLDLLKQGDVIFGAEGFCKGRSVILVDEQRNTISNIHGVIFHPRDGSMTRGIFLGCFLGYLRKVGIVDAIGAGGSGGSLAIGYLDQVPFPMFPDEVQDHIARLYHNPEGAPTQKRTLHNFCAWHRSWNETLGIWELDREMKNLQETLARVIELIVFGQSVELPSG